MLNAEFEIEIELANFSDEVSSFTLGHMILTYGAKTISSKDKIPNQSMMIFISLSQLLDDLRLFLISNNRESYNFVGVDSSFQFYLFKAKKMIELKDSKHELICVVSETQIVESFWKGISNFLLKYSSCLGRDEIVYEDLKNSVLDFKGQFKIDDETFLL